MSNLKYVLLVLGLVFLTCKNPDKAEQNNLRQLNVSILLDLSDRIDTTLHPLQVRIDTENIKLILDIFKSHLNSVGIFKAKAKLKIFFYPPPVREDVISVARRLMVDFNATDSTSMNGVTQKIRLFKSIDSVFMHNLGELYRCARQDRYYPGADLWTFFNDEVDDQCLESPSEYRNILVILTDGYMFWENNLRNPIGNRYTYITAKAHQLVRFRRMRDWKSTFKNEDYGFVDVRKNLSDLEVLVLGINPEREEDFEIIKAYWEKWFLEMKIKPGNMKLIRTELPVKSRIIENFFKAKD